MKHYTIIEFSQIWRFFQFSPNLGPSVSQNGIYDMRHYPKCDLSDYNEHLTRFVGSAVHQTLNFPKFGYFPIFSPNLEPSVL